MAKLARKAMGHVIRNFFSLAVVFLLKWLIVDYFHEGWAGYGHVAFYASVLSIGLVIVASLLFAAWDLLTD